MRNSVLSWKEVVGLVAILALCQCCSLLNVFDGDKEVPAAIVKTLPELLSDVIPADKEQDGSETSWQTAPFELDGHGWQQWVFTLDCRDQDRTRAHGEPERMWAKVYFEDAGWYELYAMIDNRNMFRYRLKSPAGNSRATNLGVIPQGEFTVSLVGKDGRLAFYVDGTKRPKHNVELPGPIEKLRFNHDGHRPAGIQYRNAKLEEL